MSTERERPPSIVDVARVAEVSVPTVSRVLTGAARVSGERRERVLAAMQELGYWPNAAARALVTGKQRSVAVLASDTTRYGFALTIKGIEEAARQAGYIVTITVIESDRAPAVSAAVELALSHPVAGVIVLKFDPPGMKALKALPQRIPAVAASGGAGRQVPHAVLDDSAGGRQATEYLLGLGHRTVHHIAVPYTGRRSGRAAGWRHALEAAGAEVPEPLQATWDPLDGYTLGLTIAGREDVTAILCGNDEIALGVLRAAHELGRPVPDELSVVGFDGQAVTALSTPALTTVEQDFKGLGLRAFELLAARMGGEAPSNSVATPSLVVRESTASPARPPRRTAARAARP